MRALSSNTSRALVLGWLGCLGLACSSGHSNPLLAMLPADNEVETWGRADAPVLVKTDTDLYNRIDGAGAAFIDHGWQAAVEATYVQAGQTIDVAIHDMGSADNAQAMYNYNLPISRTAIPGFSDGEVSVGQTSCQGSAFVGRYYIQVSISDASDAALASLEAFILAIVDRGRSLS